MFSSLEKKMRNWPDCPLRAFNFWLYEFFFSLHHCHIKPALLPILFFIALRFIKKFCDSQFMHAYMTLLLSDGLREKNFIHSINNIEKFSPANVWLNCPMCSGRGCQYMWTKYCCWVHERYNIMHCGWNGENSCLILNIGTCYDSDVANRHFKKVFNNHRNWFLWCFSEGSYFDVRVMSRF